VVTVIASVRAQRCPDRQPPRPTSRHLSVPGQPAGRRAQQWVKMAGDCLSGRRRSCWQPGDGELCRGYYSGGMASSRVATGYLREALGVGRHRRSCFVPVRLILWARRISDEPIMTCRIWRGDLSFRGEGRRRRTTGDRMQLIQLLRLQKAHDQNRQLMRFVMMPLLSCARAAIVMFQTVQSWIGPSCCFSCRCLENLSGGLGSQIDASEGVHKIPRCDYL